MSSVTSKPIPLLFMYSRPLKFRMIERVVGKLASEYASMRTSSAKAETSPSISMILTVLLILRTFITTLACGMGKSPLACLVSYNSLRCERTQAISGYVLGYHVNHTATTSIYTLTLHGALPLPVDSRV